MAIVKHTLYIGLCDKDSKTQKIGVLAAREIINNLVLSSGYDGATISEAVGIYKHDGSGEVVIEPSIRVEVLFAEHRKTIALCEALKAALNQETIAMQIEKVNSTLV